MFWFELHDDGIVHIIFGGNVIPSVKANFQKEETKLAIKSAVTKAIGKDVAVKYDNFRWFIIEGRLLWEDIMVDFQVWVETWTNF